MRRKKMSTFLNMRPQVRLAGLGTLVLALLALGAGCSNINLSSLKFWGTAKSPSGLQVRPASDDTSRLLRNAHYFSLMGRGDMALKELEEAHQQDPQNLKVANALARGYEAAGQWERAQQVYQEALSRDGNNPALYNNLCYSYYQAGNFQKAEDCFRQALAQDPKNVAARNNLGLLLCRTGRQAEAHRLWQEAEGEVAAEKRMKEVLAFLSMEGSGTHARPASPAVPPAAPAAAAPEKPQQVATRPEAGKFRETATPARNRTVSPPKAEAASVKPAPAPTIAAQKATTPEAVPAKAGPAPQPAAAIKITSSLTASAPVNAAAAIGPRERQRPLTVQELTETKIRVENGNGCPDLAREARHLLWGEGFNVVAIKNYIDFGVQETVIYCRPGAVKLARVLGEKFFHTANVKVKEELPGGIDVRVIMGYDLLLKEDLLAKLAG